MFIFICKYFHLLLCLGNQELIPLFSDKEVSLHKLFLVFYGFYLYLRSLICSIIGLKNVKLMLLQLNFFKQYQVLLCLQNVPLMISEMNFFSNFQSFHQFFHHFFHLNFLYQNSQQLFLDYDLLENP